MKPFVHKTEVKDVLISAIAGWEMATNHTPVPPKSQLWYNIAWVVEEYYHDSLGNNWSYYVGTIVWEALSQYLFRYYYPDRPMAECVADNYVHSNLHMDTFYRHLISAEWR